MLGLYHNTFAEQFYNLLINDVTFLCIKSNFPP